MFTNKILFHFVLGVILFAEAKYVQVNYKRKNSVVLTSCNSRTGGRRSTLRPPSESARRGGDKVTSKVSPKHVDKGETATVTCHFPYDVSQMTTVWVIVEHLPDNKHAGEKVDLAECTKRNTFELKCAVLERGYVIENDVKTSLELRITNILARHSGHYRCLLVPPEGVILTSKKRRLSVLGGDKVTCKASPKQVKIGETATVTCQFPYNVSQMTTAWVTIDYFPERKEEDLVDCTKVNSEELKCTVWKQGYVIEGNVTSSLKLRITNISAQHSGRYRCQMVPPEGKRPKARKCRLVVFSKRTSAIPVPTTTERTIETSAGVESNGKLTSAIPVPTTTERTIETSDGVESNGSDMDKETKSAVTPDVPSVLAVTVMTVVVLVAVAVIVILLKNRGLLKRSGDEGEKEDRGVDRIQRAKHLLDADVVHVHSMSSTPCLSSL